MRKKSKQELPYEENDKSFGGWFRITAKDKWEKYLRGDEKDISIEERDAMRKFLIEHGTKEEMQAKLDSFGLNMPAYEALREENKSKCPDVKPG